MPYDLDPVPDNCYPGTTVLVNKLNIREADQLDRAEALLTLVKASRLEMRPIKGSFNFTHYKSIHKFLFDKLYDWGGQVRSVNISKKGTMFCPFHLVEGLAASIFGRMKGCDYFKGLQTADFIAEIVDFYSATNYLHPFREGNGRAQRSFLTQLIRNAGYDIHFSEIDGELLMIATIQSANGVNDLLYDIFRRAVRPI